jgi:HSP20 family protein
LREDELSDEVERLERRMKRMSEEVARRVKEFESSSGILEPLYEVSERPEEMVVSIDMPGVCKEDIVLQATENRLYVDAECKKGIYLKGHARGHVRVFKRYRKAIALPLPVDPDKAKASVRNGVLEIRLPKRKGGVNIQVE